MVHCAAFGCAYCYHRPTRPVLNGQWFRGKTSAVDPQDLLNIAESLKTAWGFRRPKHILGRLVSFFGMDFNDFHFLPFLVA